MHTVAGMSKTETTKSALARLVSQPGGQGAPLRRRRGPLRQHHVSGRIKRYQQHRCSEPLRQQNYKNYLNPQYLLPKAAILPHRQVLGNWWHSVSLSQGCAPPPLLIPEPVVTFAGFQELMPVPLLLCRVRTVHVQFLVLGLERSRKGAGVHALHRRLAEICGSVTAR
jgi:hypothetical protein